MLRWIAIDKPLVLGTDVILVISEPLRFLFDKL